MKLFAVVLLLAVVAGCGTSDKHNFFKPELSGAFYAAPPATPAAPVIAVRQPAQGVLKIQLTNCYFTSYGWICDGDTFDTSEPGQTLSDQAGGYWCSKLIPAIGTAITP